MGVYVASIYSTNTTIGGSNIALPVYRFNFSASTNIFFNVLSQFGSGSVSAGGQWFARRAR
jgi:hypothetical protein